MIFEHERTVREKMALYSKNHGRAVVVYGSSIAARIIPKYDDHIIAGRSISNHRDKPCITPQM